MVNSRDFPNLKLEHLKGYSKYGIIVAFGFRTAILLNSDLDVICRYLDSNKSEKYLCAEFFECNFENFCSPNNIFLLLAGESGVIKIIDIKEAKLTTFLKGHTGAIHTMKVVDHFVISGGEDSSIRIWNLKTLACISVCGGLAGHKDLVSSIDALPGVSMIVSAGTDCVINQWKFDFKSLNPQMIFNHEPFSSFNNVHKCPITKIKYCGNLIFTLSNNEVSVIYNHADDLDLEDKFSLARNDTVYLGSVHFFGNCKSFEILGNMLIGVSTAADIYIFDLRNIFKEQTPYLISTNIEHADDIIVLSDNLYITSGSTIHRLNVDFDHFD